MNILYLANIRLPTEKAHGIQIMHTCSALAKAGAEVALVIPARRNSITEEPFEYYDITREENFNIAKLSCPDPIRFGLVGSMLQAAMFSLASFFFVLRRRKNYDVIYSRSESLLLLLSVFRKPVFWESHVGAYTFWARHILPRLSGLITITGAGKKLYESHGLPPEKILVAHDGVDVGKFSVKESMEECRRKLGLPLGKKIVGYIGVGGIGIYDWKGIDIFLKAAQNFRDDTIFLFVGHGREDAVREMKARYAASNIFFIGRQDHTTLPCYMKACDALVLANKKGDSISERYSSPMKLFEYMASGTPIVASHLPNIREVLDESMAVFFEPNNPESLAAALKKLFADNALGLGEKISGNALLEVKKYSWQKRGESILAFMRKNT